MCHIFPHCLMNEKKQTGLEHALPNIWKLLALFFDAEHLDKWRRALFTDLDNPEKVPDVCENLICLTHNLNADWSSGLCAFKPLHLSSDCTELHIEFHWLPRQLHGPFDNVDLTKSPLSSEGLDRVGGHFHTMLESLSI